MAGALILAAVLTACPPDPDLSGLIAAMRETAGRLTGLDAEAVKDGADALEARAREREGLCEELEGSARRIRVLEADVASYRDLLDLANARADGLRLELQNRPIVAPKRRLFSCTAGAISAEPWAGVACGLALW